MYEKSIGELLKDTREQKNITIEQVVQDTHISRRLIAAMEEERFNEFAGDTYLMGFLKNYANYLGIDGPQLVQRYRNLKTQEQPAPIADLLEMKRPKKKIIIPLVAAIIGILGGLAIFFWQNIEGLANSGIFERRARATVNGQSDDQQNNANTNNERDAPRGRYFPLTGRALERSFRVSTGISYTLQGVPYYLAVESIGNSVTLRLRERSIELQQQQPVAIDINGNDIADLSAELKDILQGNNRAIIRFEVGGDLRFQDTPVRTASAETSAVTNNNRGNTAVASRRRSLLDLGEVTISQPYPIIITARSPTVIHYQLKGQSRVEQFLNSAEKLELVGNQELQLWIANAGAVDFIVGEAPVSLGSPGQVRVFSIRRTPLPLTSRATLQLIPYY